MNTLLIIGSCFVIATVLMVLLTLCRVNILKLIVLLGTFALAMAFAGNDLVIFIGTPLTGRASYQDYIANGTGDPKAFIMHSLNGTAQTPVCFLRGAGFIMVLSLVFSKKAQNVVKTSVDLCRQDEGDNFTPVDSKYVNTFNPLRKEEGVVMDRTRIILENNEMDKAEMVRSDAKRLQGNLSEYRKRIMDDIQNSSANIETMTVFLNIVQESMQILASLRHMMRGIAKFQGKA